MARQRRGIEMGVLLLLGQLLNSGLETFPPVTLIVMAGQVITTAIRAHLIATNNFYFYLQVALYMGLIPVSWDAVSVCLSAQAVLKWKEYERLVLSAFEHGDDIHLYYNMLSFLAKGRTLELHFGSPYFAYLLGVFTVLTSVTYVGIEVLLTEILDDRQYYKSCAIGFSGVIFALKVLTTAYWETGYRRYFGIRVSGKYAVWLELVAIQLMVPNASFAGHLAGILVGVSYTQGPLKFLMDLPIQTFGHINSSTSRRNSRRQSNWGSGTTGYRTAPQPSNYGWNIGSEVNDADYDEAVRRSYETLRNEGINNPSEEDPEEIRRRRLNRFNFT